MVALHESASTMGILAATLSLPCKEDAVLLSTEHQDCGMLICTTPRCPTALMLAL
jgi:hypothetical protein